MSPITNANDTCNWILRFPITCSNRMFCTKVEKMIWRLTPSFFVTNNYHTVTLNSRRIVISPQICCRTTLLTYADRLLKKFLILYQHPSYIVFAGSRTTACNLTDISRTSIIAQQNSSVDRLMVITKTKPKTTLFNTAASTWANFYFTL